MGSRGLDGVALEVVSGLCESYANLCNREEREVSINNESIVREDQVEKFMEGVRNNLDPYGAGVQGSVLGVLAMLGFGQTPAEAMECILPGLSGFQAGCVASLVSQVAPRGEEFRVWWNLHTQIKDEGEKANVSGGILNPALMTFAEKEK